MEIERKFIVKYLPDLNGCEKKGIIQGYISFEPEIRIRQIDDEYFITRKSDGTLKREELEIKINQNTFIILSDLIQSEIICKTRYIKHLNDDLKSEIDVYHGNNEGLTIVEVEFKSEEEALGFIVPDWFGEEVTLNSEYKNKNLARRLD